MNQPFHPLSAGTDAGIQSWLDRLYLSPLLAELSSAVDRADHDRIVACYAEDSYDDHGAFQGSGREFADYICAPSDAKMHHLLGQSVFDVQGDEAWSETFFIFHRMTASECQPRVGRYVDYFQRVGSDLKLKYRRVVADQTVPG
jgi:SnoaL-like domain